jgi:tetratricopeptide (TPR) repeat protein
MMMPGMLDAVDAEEPTISFVDAAVLEEPAAIISNEPSEMPDWVRMMAANQGQPSTPPPPAASAVPDWMQEVSLDKMDSEAANVLTALSALEPAKETPPPAPVAPPVAAPAPARLARVGRQRTPRVENPPVLLNTAREQATTGSVLPALESYQQLIDHSEMLEETRADLRQLAEQNPKEPKIFRLLGDTHMRLGDLQAALDTYLSALNQL